MALTSIKVDVYCTTTNGGQPSYRVYVDDELLTERTWIWAAYETYICENIEVELDSGEHEVKIAPIGKLQPFKPKNLRVNGIDIQPISPQKLTFSVE